MATLALIPARGGSKGVPGKNLRHVGDRSLLARAIEAAFASGACDHVMVSTDDDAIAAEARRCEAAVPGLRPHELAEDETAMAPVIEHAVLAFEAANRITIDTLVLLEPTVPFRKSTHVAAAVARFRQGDVRSAVAVCPLERKPENILVKQPNLTVGRYVRDPRESFARRQDMAHLCRVSSGVYVVGRADWFAERELLLAPVGYVDMSAEESLNIDTELDLMLARLIARQSGL